MTNDKTIGCYNPLNEDFSRTYDSGGENPQEIKIPSREIVYFTPEIALYAEKHLYNAIVNARNLNGIALNADPEKKQAILDEIRV